jgi:tetratricopeptide (TPR) repeat protein
VSGEIANLLQAEGEHSEAVDWYERAVGFFSECLEFGLVASAAKGAGISQLALGDLEASEAMLRSLLQMIIPSDDRARVIHSLLNTRGAKVQALLESHQTAEAALTCTEIKQLLAEARQQPKLSKASKLFIKTQENNMRILSRKVANPA